MPVLPYAVFMPRYDLLAIDLDGTLLDPSGSVSAASIDAVGRARDAGITILPCTGRGLVESRFALDAIGHTGPVVTAGGAITVDAATGSTLHRFALDAEIVAESVGHIHASGHAALVFKDAAATGFDYLVLGGEQGFAIDPITTWWFKESSINARYASTVADDDFAGETVRVGACLDACHAEPLVDRLRDHLGDRAAMHSFPAVIADHHNRTVHMLEVFHQQSNKWAAIEQCAGQLDIDLGRIAAIGDQINDIEMIEGAALGIAMGNAVSAVKAVADRHAPSNADEGVAFAIDRLLTEDW